MTSSTLPSVSYLIQGLDFIALKYEWLAIVQHLVVLILGFCYWVYRKRMGWLLSLYFFFTSILVGALALVETNNVITCAVFAVLAVMFIGEVFSPEMDYSTKSMKNYNLVVALLVGFYALWYPVSGDYIYSLVASPYGILPVPTLAVMMSFFLVVHPRTNRKLHGFMTLSSLYYGLMGALRFKIYWDIPLAIIAVYSLIALNLSKDRIKY